VIRIHTKLYHIPEVSLIRFLGGLRLVRGRGDDQGVGPKAAGLDDTPFLVFLSIRLEREYTGSGIPNILRIKVSAGY
jgi:hypothetical protein